MMVNAWLKHWRYHWSAIRHRNSIKNVPSNRLASYMIHVPQTIQQVRTTMRELYSRFEWTQDGFDRLYDSIDSPASSWHKAFNSPPLKDDCDGFHSALYWAVSFNFSCRLLTVATRNIKDSHSVLVIKHKGQYYLANYTYLSRPLTSVADVIADLEDTYYKDKNTTIIAWELSRWNGARWETGSI